MRPLFRIAVPLALAVLLLAGLATTQAQTPAPSPAPDPFCEAAYVQGGGPHTIGVVAFDLPAGTYTIAIPPPGGAQPAPIKLCHRESGAILEIDSTDCDEVSRVANDAAAEATVDAIIGSCHIAPTPTPEPPPLICPGGEAVTGGRMVTIADAIQVALPVGEFVVQVHEDVAQICNRAEEYSLALRLTDCGRSDISPPDAPAAEGHIQPSCTLLHPVTPVPTVPILVETGSITPPSTGDAGLRSATGN